MQTAKTSSTSQRLVRKCTEHRRCMCHASGPYRLRVPWTPHPAALPRSPTTGAAAWCGCHKVLLRDASVLQNHTAMRWHLPIYLLVVYAHLCWWWASLLGPLHGTLTRRFLLYGVMVSRPC